MIIQLLYTIGLAIASTFAHTLNVDTHSHGEWSDIKGTLDDSVSWHQNRGFDAMVVTNHDYLTPSTRINELNQKYIVLPGLEWSTRANHMIVMFNPDTYNDTYTTLRDNPLLLNSGICNPQSIDNDLVTLVHAHGAIVGRAHYTMSAMEALVNGVPWLTCDTRGLHYWMALGADFVEVANTIADKYADQFSTTYQMIKTAGTDVHEVDTGIVVAKTAVDIGTNPVSAQSIFNAIRAGNTTIVYSGWWYGMLSNQVRTIVYIIAACILLVIVLPPVLVCMYFILRQKCNKHIV